MKVLSMDLEKMKAKILFKEKERTVTIKQEDGDMWSFAGMRYKQKGEEGKKSKKMKTIIKKTGVVEHMRGEYRDYIIVDNFGFLPVGWH